MLLHGLRTTSFFVMNIRMNVKLLYDEYVVETNDGSLASFI